MIRTETYLDGHLVKEFSMVNIGPSAEKPYDDWIDGRHRWFLDGDEITEARALELRRARAEIDAGADVMAEIVDDLIGKSLRPE